MSSQQHDDRELTISCFLVISLPQPCGPFRKRRSKGRKGRKESRQQMRDLVAGARRILREEGRKDVSWRGCGGTLG